MPTLADPEAEDFERWACEEPNVAIKTTKLSLEFWDADGLKFRVTNGPYLKWGENATALFVNGRFVFLHNPFWVYDLFDELAVGGFIYHGGEK